MGRGDFGYTCHKVFARQNPPDSEMPPRPPASPPEPPETRNRLLAAAAKIAVDRGYDGVTMQNIAAGAGVSRVTVYKYFANRDEALMEIAVRWGIEALGKLGELGMELPADQRAYVRLCAIIGHAHKSPRLISAVLQAMVTRGGRWTEQNLEIVERYLGLHDEVAPASELRQITRSFGYILHILLLSTCSGNISLKDAKRDLAFIIKRLYPGGHLDDSSPQKTPARRRSRPEVAAHKPKHRQ